MPRRAVTGRCYRAARQKGVARINPGHSRLNRESLSSRRMPAVTGEKKAAMNTPLLLVTRHGVAANTLQAEQAAFRIVGKQVNIANG